MAPAEPAIANLANIKLGSNPNPFRESSTISFVLPAAGHVQLAVYDITGKQMALLVNAWLQAGTHKTTFTSHSVPAGSYIMKMVYNGKVITKKLLKE